MKKIFSLLLGALFCASIAAPAQTNVLYLTISYTPSASATQATPGTINLYRVWLANGVTSCPALSTTAAYSVDATTATQGTWGLLSSGTTGGFGTTPSSITSQTGWSSTYCYAITVVIPVTGLTGGLESPPTTSLLVVTPALPAVPAAPTGLSYTLSLSQQ